MSFNSMELSPMFRRSIQSCNLTLIDVSFLFPQDKNHIGMLQFWHNGECIEEEIEWDFQGLIAVLWQPNTAVKSTP